MNNELDEPPRCNTCICKECGREVHVLQVSKAMADRVREWSVCCARFSEMIETGDYKKHEPLWQEPIPPLKDRP